MHDEVAAGFRPGDFLVEVEPVMDAGADAVLACDAEDGADVVVDAGLNRE